MPLTDYGDELLRSALRPTWAEVYAIFRVAFGDHPEVRIRVIEDDVRRVLVVWAWEEPWGVSVSIELTEEGLIEGRPFAETAAREVVRGYEQYNGSGMRSAVIMGTGVVL